MEFSPIAREEGIWLFEGQLLFHQLLLNPVFENPLHMNTLLQKEQHCNKTSEVCKPSSSFSFLFSKPSIKLKNRSFSGVSCTSSMSETIFP